MIGPRRIGCGLALLSWGTCWAQVTQRVSVGSNGEQGDDNTYSGSISADGRFVVFNSASTNLVPGDSNSARDVFVRDRLTGMTALASLDSGGAQANTSSYDASITADGRFVAFESWASNLVPGDTNFYGDVFVRDLQGGTTERVSVDSSGAQGNAWSAFPWISADGRYVAFVSSSTNLVPGDTNARFDIFVRDRQGGTTERVSVDSNGVEGNGSSLSPSISADGRFVVFMSDSTNLVPGDANGFADIFLRDRQGGTTERLSTSSASTEADQASSSCSISADGRYVVFLSAATNLVSGDTNFHVDVFVRDRQSHSTARASVASSGAQGDADCYFPSISADGASVGFTSDATNLVPGDTNGRRDAFLRILSNGTTERVSLDSSGVQGNDHSYYPSISADGRYVAFRSDSSNLVVGDTNVQPDLFVRDRLGGPGWTSLCDPGVGGVIPCPCGNPPAGAGRGCDNSASTGGAILTASGGTYLSSDSLVFATSGEKPTALSIVSQWSGTSATGVIFGMGVRCTSGTLKRLYTKSAVGGSITAPSFGAGDVQVSVRSAALGDPILAGQSRWYLVYYRDPIVLGGCPSSSTFNATQTGVVSWSP